MQFLPTWPAGLSRLATDFLNWIAATAIDDAPRLTEAEKRRLRIVAERIADRGYDPSSANVRVGRGSAHGNR